MINISQLIKHYGKSKGIENVSLDIQEGEIFGLNSIKAICWIGW